MRVLDPGHLYEVDLYDGVPNGATARYLRFMKRIGSEYPQNKGDPYAGTNCQEVLRVLIDRVRYLNGQVPDRRNDRILSDLRSALWNFELRAAERRGEPEPFLKRVRDWAGDGWNNQTDRPLCVELIPTCGTCGHILCIKYKNTVD